MLSYVLQFSVLKAFHKPRVRAVEFFVGKIGVSFVFYSAKFEVITAQKLIFKLKTAVKVVVTVLAVAKQRHIHI